MSRSVRLILVPLVGALLLAGLISTGVAASGATHRVSSGVHGTVGSSNVSAGQGFCSTSVRCTPVSPQRSPAPTPVALGLGFIAMAAPLLFLGRRRLRSVVDRRPPPGADPSIFHPPMARSVVPVA